MHFHKAKKNDGDTLDDSDDDMEPEVKKKQEL